MTHTDDTERKAFEAWISAPPFEQSVRRYGNDPQTAAWPGNYREYNVQLAWCAWEARAALAAPSVPSGEPVAIVCLSAPHWMTATAGGKVYGPSEVKPQPTAMLLRDVPVGTKLYAAPQPAPAGWRPMETAPKDGTLFLCWVSAARYGETDEGQQYQQDASQVDFCSWRNGPPDLPGHGYFDPCCGQIGDSQDVTHWMPLPAAPTAPGA